MGNFDTFLLKGLTHFMELGYTTACVDRGRIAQWESTCLTSRGS